MTLPEAIPTLKSFSTGNMTRVDNVFCTPQLLERVIKCDANHGAQPTKTDHFPIETVFNLQTTITDHRKRHNWKKVEWDTMKEHLEKELEMLGEPKEITTEDEFWNTLRKLDSTIEKVIDEHVPYTKPSPHQRRWWNEQLTSMRK
ncbi:hypothetical protein F5050DRAFT_1540143, partial [Lentinula boryana]